MDASKEDLSNGMERRFVEDMKLVEVSIIDNRKIPCYVGTSIETRAKGEEKVVHEPLEVRAEYVETETQLPDYTKYKNRIKELKKE